MLRGYCRVSTLEQARDDRTSLAEQEKHIRAAAVLLGIDQIQVYADAGVSGGIALAERPAGARLMADLQSGDVLVSAKLDRAFRACEDALITVRQLKERNVGVVMLDISPEPLADGIAGKFFLTIMAAAAEFDKGRLLERMADGKRGKKARGGSLGGLPRWGTRVKGRGRAAKVVADEAEQKVLDFVRQANGSLRGIARQLIERGITTRRGTPLSASQVMRMRRGVNG
jgi:DNA invertase Pin-like site-specific DNA recombinase